MVRRRVERGDHRGHRAQDGLGSRERVGGRGHDRLEHRDARLPRHRRRLAHARPRLAHRRSARRVARERTGLLVERGRTLRDCHVAGGLRAWRDRTWARTRLKARRRRGEPRRRLESANAARLALDLDRKLAHRVVALARTATSARLRNGVLVAARSALLLRAVDWRLRRRIRLMVAMCSVPDEVAQRQEEGETEADLWKRVVRV